MAVRQVARETRHGVGWGRLAHCDWLPSVGYFSRLRETKGMSKAKKQTTEPETTKHCSRKARTTSIRPRRMLLSIDFAKNSHFLKIKCSFLSHHLLGNI